MIVDSWKRDDTGTFDKVEVRNLGPERGNGLIARERIEDGSEVCRDVPLIAMQHIFSSRLTPACMQCLKTVGNLKDHLQRIILNQGTAGENSLEASYQSVASHPLLNHSRLDSGRKLVPCLRQGCCEVFCSETCRKHALTNGFHRVLCSDLPDDRRKKFAEFEAHARKHHENFILAGYAFAQIICLVVHHKIPLENVMREFLVFARRPWYELPDKSGGSTLEERLEWLQGSLALLSEALYIPTLGLEPLFEFQYFSNLLGQFDLVNVNIEYSNPLERVLQKAIADKEDELHELMQLCESSGLFRDVRQIVQCVTEDDDEMPVDDDDIMPPMMGIGLVRCIALTNHSCDPNVEVDYQGDKTCVVRAIRVIKEGEEITTSYIDDEMPLERRQAELRADYLFVCRCVRCRVEAYASLVARREGKEPDACSVASMAGVTVEDVQRIWNHRPPKEMGESSNTACDPR